MLLKLSSKCSQNWQQTDKKLQAYASSCMCTQTTYLKKNVTSERFLNRINCIIHQKTYVRRKQAPKSQKYFRFVLFSNIQGKECKNWFEYLKMIQISMKIPSDILPPSLNFYYSRLYNGFFALFQAMVAWINLWQLCGKTTRQQTSRIL